MNLANHDDQSLEDLLRASYAVLRKSEPEQRQAVIDRFIDSRKLAGEPARRDWRVRLGWFAAACVLMGIAAQVLFFLPSTAVVYGLEAVPQRLGEVRTIRVRGSEFVHNPEKPGAPPIRVPIEYLIKRPDKFRFTSIGVSHNRDKIEITQGGQICDGQRLAPLSAKGKPSGAIPVHSINARLTTEAFAQGYLLSAVLGPRAFHHKKIGQEQYQGTPCDLYELRYVRSGDQDEEDGDTVTLEKLWFDPVSGYPVRLTRDEIQPNGAVLRMTEFNEISVNLELGDELFAITPPKMEEPLDAAAEKDADDAPLVMWPTGSGSNGVAKLEIWHALRISEGSAVIIWRRSRPEANPDWLSGMEFKQPDCDGGEILRHQWVYQSDSPDDWNWSLLTISKGPAPDPFTINMLFKADRFESTMGDVALRFSDKELEAILTAAARVSLPEDGPKKAKNWVAEILARGRASDSARPRD